MQIDILNNPLVRLTSLISLSSFSVRLSFACCRSSSTFLFFPLQSSMSSRRPIYKMKHLEKYSLLKFSISIGWTSKIIYLDKVLRVNKWQQKKIMYLTIVGTPETLLVSALPIIWSTSFSKFSIRSSCDALSFDFRSCCRSRSWNLWLISLISLGAP